MSYMYKNNYVRDFDIDRTFKNSKGEIIHYDVCAKTYEGGKAYYRADKFEYVGEGVIYTLNGVRQTFTETKYFWKRKY